MTKLSTDLNSNTEEWLNIKPLTISKKGLASRVVCAGVCMVVCDDTFFVSSAKDVYAYPNTALNALRAGIHSNSALQKVYDSTPPHISENKFTFKIRLAETQQDTITIRNAAIAELRANGKKVLNVR